MQRKQSWVIGAVLRALGRNVTSTQQPFTASDLVAWEPAFAKSPKLPNIAFAGLHRNKVVESVAMGHLPSFVDQRWTLTPKGLAICRASAQAQPGAAPPDPNALNTRLWNLLRIRRTLTSEDAACLLVDAGAGDDLARTQRLVSGYLRAWATLVPDAVKVSAQRIGGCKRYVLVKDSGIHPPPTKSTGIAPVAAPSAFPVPKHFKADTE